MKYLCPKCGIEMKYYRVRDGNKIIEYLRCPRCGYKVFLSEIILSKNKDTIELHVKKNPLYEKPVELGTIVSNG